MSNLLVIDETAVLAIVAVARIGQSSRQQLTDEDGEDENGRHFCSNVFGAKLYRLIDCLK